MREADTMENAEGFLSIAAPAITNLFRRRRNGLAFGMCNLRRPSPLFLFLLLRACLPANMSKSSPGVETGLKPAESTPFSTPTLRRSTDTAALEESPFPSPSFPPKPAVLRQVAAGLDRPTLLVYARDEGDYLSSSNWGRSAS
jgi:hypothetical protein